MFSNMAANTLLKITWGVVKNAVPWVFSHSESEPLWMKLIFTQDPQVVNLYNEPLVIVWYRQDTRLIQSTVKDC